jgi:iron-sulfur cluster repair protein YtfE (RIC family)
MHIGVTSKPIGTVTSALRADHSRLDALLKETLAALTDADAATAGRTSGSFSQGLRHHIEAEDQVLFPPFEARTGLKDAGPTAVMRRDHQEIERRLREISRAIAAPYGSRETACEVRALKALLEDHNAREEEILYPWCDRVLDDLERAAVDLYAPRDRSRSLHGSEKAPSGAGSAIGK